MAVDEDNVGEGITIQDADTMYQHLMLHHSLPDPDSAPANCVHTTRSYWVIRKEDINRSLPSSVLKTVKGTRQVHSLRGLGDKKISTRNPSCFCDCCMGDVASVCMSKGYAEDWQQKEINFTKSWSAPSALSHGTPPTASDSHAQPASPPSPCQTSRAQPSFPNHAQPASPPSPCQTNRAPPPSTNREQIFQSILDQMARSRNYTELEGICRDSAALVTEIALPPKEQHYLTTPPGVSVDSMSLQLLPHDAPPLHFPVNIIGDGNCLPRTVSMLTFGLEERHIEMRVHLVMDMSMHFHLYLNHNFLSKGTSDAGQDSLEKLQLYSEEYSDHQSAVKALQKLIYGVGKPSKECGM